VNSRPLLIAKAVSILVLCGWANDKWSLADFGGAVTCKPVTCVCLGLVSVALQIRLAYPLYSRALNGFVLFYSLSSLMWTDTQWFLHEPEEIAKFSTAPGVPSLATVGLIVTWVMCCEFGWFPTYGAWASVVMGSMAIAGNILQVGWLMFFHHEYSTAMAIPTGLVFVLFGVHALNSKGESHVDN